MQPTAPPPPHNRMEPHVKAVAVINIVLGVLGLVAALLIMLGLGIASAVTGSVGQVDWLPGFLAALGFFLVAIVATVAVLYLLAGINLNQRKHIGKTLGIVTAALSLVTFPPLGIAFGIYALWVLLQRETDALLVP